MAYFEEIAKFTANSRVIPSFRKQNFTQVMSLVDIVCGRDCCGRHGLWPRIRCIMAGSTFSLQGAPESVIERCDYVRVGTNRLPMTPEIKEEIYKHVRSYGTGQFFYSYSELHFRLFTFFIFYSFILVKVKRSSSSCTHLTAMGRQLPSGITQCYLPPDTSERDPPNPS